MAKQQTQSEFARRMALADKFRLDLAIEKMTGEADFLLRDDDPLRSGTWRVYRTSGSAG